MARMIGLGVFVGLLLIVSFGGRANAQVVSDPIVLQFTPEADQSDRYMFRMSLLGTVVLPWTEQDKLLIPEFGLNTIWEDSVSDVTGGVNRHNITFYLYDVSTLNFSSGGFGGAGGGGRGAPGIGPGGPGSSGSSSSLPSFRDIGGADEFNMPGSLGYTERGGKGEFGPLPRGEIGGTMQGDGGGGSGDQGGGAKAGSAKANFDISKITTSSIDYVTLKTGQVIDIRGLEQLSEYSDAQVANEEIMVDVRNIFEWTHMLVLPPYPVYLEDFWYAEIPLHVPGLPDPIPTKLYFQVMDFRRVLTRRIAVIDMSGLVEFDQYWDRKDELENTWEKKYRAFGNMAISARYMFDLDKKEIFAVARPRMDLPRYYRGGYRLPSLPGDASQFGAIGLALRAVWGMPNPGLSVSTRMRYFTRLEEKRKLRTSAGKEPEYVRKYIEVTYFGQEEAE